MPSRLDVTKTYKLYIDGKFPRSESGRTVAVNDAKGKVLAHLSKASRKDLRDAVSAARKAQPGWRDATAYLRGQVLYRMAEMMEGKRDEWAEANAEPLRKYREQLNHFQQASLFDELPAPYRERRRQRVDATVAEQHDLLDRLETAGDPLLRVLAVLVPSSENAA